MKGDRFNLNQCLKNDFEKEQMKNVLYTSVVGSIMYVQVYTRPNITFIVSLLERYQSNLGMDHWKEESLKIPSRTERQPRDSWLF